MTLLEHCRKWIEDALEYSGGSHDFQDVVDGILAGRMQLWPAEKGCAVTEIVLYPKKSVLHVFLAGGEMETIVNMIDSAVAWGKTQGCTSMTTFGRVLKWSLDHLPLASIFQIGFRLRLNKP